MSSELAYRPFDQQFLELSWAWLNDPEIKRLTDTPDFSRDDQEAWWRSLENRADYFVWGVALAGRPIGVVGLKNVARISAELFCYLGEKDCWGLGYGRRMVGFGLRQAAQLGVRVVFLRVVKENLRAIAAYRRYGFLEIGKADAHLWMSRLTMNSDDERLQ